MPAIGINMSLLRGLVKLLLVIVSLNAMSDEIDKKDLTIGISFSIPPYVIQKNDDGLELALLKRCLEKSNYKVNIAYLPSARTLLNFEDGQIDGVINVKDGTVKGFYTDVVITFRNYAISLRENDFQIHTISDLAGKSIVAFQKASKFLEPSFGQLAKSNRSYGEVADQSLQVKQLLKHRVDIVVMEQKIFKYLRRDLFDTSVIQGKKSYFSAAEIRQDIAYHDIFTPSDYKFAFNSKKVRDDFNENLREIRQNGEYDTIINRYDVSLELPNK